MLTKYLNEKKMQHNRLLLAQNIMLAKIYKGQDTHLRRIFNRKLEYYFHNNAGIYEVQKGEEFCGLKSNLKFKKLKIYFNDINVVKYEL